MCLCIAVIVRSVSFPNVHDINIMNRCYQKSVDKQLNGLGDSYDSVGKRVITHVPLTSGAPYSCWDGCTRVVT